MIILNKRNLVNKNIANTILTSIKSSKKYSHIDDKMIINEINLFFRKNQNLIKEFEKVVNKPKSEKFKKIVSQIKSQLHKKHSSFENINFNKLEKILNSLKNVNNIKDIDEKTIKLLFSFSKSTKERLDYYNKLYEKIFSITGVPKSISDFGCGLNPFSLIFILRNYLNLFKNKKLNYFAYEISKKHLDVLDLFFSLNPINKFVCGKTQMIDLRDYDLTSLSKTDVSFLFKVVDVIETKGHKKSEEIIKTIPSKFIVVSFATKTLSGKQMNHPYRGWFERMLERNNLDFEIIEFSNEIYYVVKK